jgi:eukaryotic-like serine/threonine-protein kinase
VDLLRIGSYRLLRKLGAGGMGEVYLAEDQRLGRYVAIKLLPSELTDGPERLARFKAEARAASALNHPNILTIYEVGSDGDTHYIATEYIEGETLRRRLLHHVELPEAIEFALGIAGALAAAHEAAIVHRDIKPENVMIRPDGWVKVVDFGIAKLAGEAGGEQEETAEYLTEPGVVKGTVQYMSPEQLRGLETDSRTDLFSLGIILYEMFAGVVPFSGRNPNEVIAAILERDPLPLSHHRSDIPPEIERIVMKLLRKERNERYQTARDLAVDLRAAKQDLELGVRERQRSGEIRATGSVRPPAARRRNAVVAAAFLAVIVAAGFAIRLWGVGQRQISSVAVLPFVNASGDPESEYLSDGITESIIHSLSQMPKLRVMARSTVFRYRDSDLDPRKIGRELGVGAVLTGRLQQVGGTLVVQADLVDVERGTQIWGEQYRRPAGDLLSIQEQIAREISQRLRLELSGEERARLAKRYTEDTEAYRLYLMGRYQWNKRTAEGFRKSIDYFREAIGRDPRYALAYAGLADGYAMLAVYGETGPADSQRAAQAAATRAIELDPGLAEAYTSLGWTRFSFDWDWHGAEEAYRRAISLNPNYATAHQWYALYLAAMLRHDEAIASMQRALDLDPLSIIISTGVGTMYYQAGRMDEAIAQFRRTLDLEPDFPRTVYELARALEVSGRVAEARVELEKLDMTHPAVRAEMARIEALEGNTAKAREMLDELTHADSGRYVNPYDLAAICVAMGERDEAIRWLETAYETHVVRLAYLLSEPMFRDLRDDARFVQLALKVGLPVR